LANAGLATSEDVTTAVGATNEAIAGLETSVGGLMTDVAGINTELGNIGQGLEGLGQGLSGLGQGVGAGLLGLAGLGQQQQQLAQQQMAMLTKPEIKPFEKQQFTGLGYQAPTDFGMLTGPQQRSQQNLDELLKRLA
jgi:hypothetical protein